MVNLIKIIDNKIKVSKKMVNKINRSNLSIKVPNLKLIFKQSNKKRLIFVGISLCIFLWIYWIQSNSINYEINNKYNQYLQNTKASNAQLNQFVIQNRYELFASYDMVSNELSNLQKNINLLKQEIPDFFNTKSQEELEKILTNSQNILKERADLLEMFKSKNAVLKNSLRYLPELIDNIQKNSSFNLEREPVLLLNKFLQNVLVYNITYDELLANNLAKQLQQIQSISIKANNKELTQDLNLVVKHGEIILDNKSQIDLTIKQLQNSQARENLQLLENTYNKFYQATENQNNTYRFFAYLALLLLLASVAYVSLGEIMRILKMQEQTEQDLQLVNEKLYQRSQDLSKLLNLQTIAENEQRTTKEKLQESILKFKKDIKPIEQGDLTIKVNIQQEEMQDLAQSYNQTIDRLRQIVEEVKFTALRVGNTTHNNELVIEKFSSDSEQQLQEISKALKQINNMAESARAVAQKAKQAEFAVKQSVKTVAESNETIDRTIDKIIKIGETAEESAQKVQLLKESSEAISKLIKLIDELSSQIQVVALSASFEASRAGEQGKEFLVVSTQLQTLAQKFIEATTDSQKLVYRINNRISEVVTVIENNSKEIVTGTKMVENIRSSLHQIGSAGTEINTLVEEIARVAVEQDRTGDAVSLIIEDIGNISRKTSSSVTQVAFSFQELSSAAQQLQERIDKFKLN
jgi:methyl-accepting chemotaxis protein